MRNIDILRVLLILFGFLLLFSYVSMTSIISNVNKNWDEYRCNPVVMPFAGFFGHDAAKNFGDCIQNQQKASMSTFLAPIEYALSLAGNLGGDLTGSVNKIRGLFNYLRNMVVKTIKTIFNVFLSIVIGFIRLIIKTKDLTMKVLGSMAVTMYMMDGTAQAGMSMWKGPPGQIMRLLCFHPDTMIKMKNGSKKYMKDIDIGETLCNDNNVLATLKIKGSNQFPFYKIYSKQLEGNILVTGSHKIQDTKTGRFIPVSQFSEAVRTDIYSDKMSCLITDDHLIPIGEYIFWDWED